MEKFEFTADPNTYEQKPTTEEAAKINNSLQPANVSTVEDFLEGIEQGIS
ncbi:hypothetical protein [Fodinibius sp. AD559]